MGLRRERPDVAVLVSSFERPWHLRRVLESLAHQTVAARMEVVVTDDGSRDETPSVVEQFAATAPFDVHFTTHPHGTYHLSRCRNEGVAASRAPYLLFLDGDCLVLPDHVEIHLRQRRANLVSAGYCYLLDEPTSARIDLDVVREGTYAQWVTPAERRRVRKMDWKARWHAALRHPTKPKLFGGNVGIWRSDYERVNGYDEEFRGWGCEDDDLRHRLRSQRVLIRSIARWTQTYHLWHPRGVTTPDQWRLGANVALLNGPPRPARCRLGLDQHLSTRRAAA